MTKHKQKIHKKKKAGASSKKENADVMTEPIMDASAVPVAAVDGSSSSKVDSKSQAPRKLSFNSARQYVMSMLTQAQCSVEDLRKRVLENERVARASERTMVFLESARTQVEQAVKLVRETPFADLRSKAVSESLVLATKGVQAFNASASQIPSQVAAHVAAARTEALKRINEASVAVNSWRAAAVSFGARKLSEFDNEHSLSAKACNLANVAVERTKSIDEKFRVTENAKMLLQRAMKMDQEWKVSESALNVAKRAQSMGDSLTGSRVSPIVNYVSELAVSSYTSSVAMLQQVKADVQKQATQQRKSLSAAQLKVE